MTIHNPAVSIGLPVYNGDNFLVAAVDSLLAQTYDDFELIISDNASSDRTEEIGRSFAARDSRVRYVRNNVNLGAAQNYNQLVDMAVGRYFKWAAHDDICAPQFLEKCVAALEAEPDVVLAHTLCKQIDERGNVIKALPPLEQLAEATPHERFHAFICTAPHQNSVFGLMRTAVLRKTIKIGAFSSSDRILNAELSLHGKFREIPEYLFFKRIHAAAHWSTHRTRRERQTWYDPRLANQRAYPVWRLFQEHVRSLNRAGLSWNERGLCLASMGHWVVKNRRPLLRELVS